MPFESFLHIEKNNSVEKIIIFPGITPVHFLLKEYLLLKTIIFS